VIYPTGHKEVRLATSLENSLQISGKVSAIRPLTWEVVQEPSYAEYSTNWCLSTAPRSVAP